MYVGQNDASITPTTTALPMGSPIRTATKKTWQSWLPPIIPFGGAADGTIQWAIAAGAVWFFFLRKKR